MLAEGGLPLLVLYIYEHEAIQKPISENNIGMDEYLVQLYKLCRDVADSHSAGCLVVTWKCMPMRINAHSANLMCDA